MINRSILFGILLLLVVGTITATQLQTVETTISASYEMLACEKCNHMTVEKSEDAQFIGETIIPVSDTVDIDKMIDSIALTREHVCLTGRFYRVNFNLLGISPEGRKFEVTALVDEAECSRL